MREYLLCLAAAAAVTYLTMPLARAFAIRWGAMAEVRDRDVHDAPTPRLGGLAMLAGLLAGMLLASNLPQMGSVFAGGAPVALLTGVAIIVGLGMVDDRWGLAAPTKLAGQVLAASVMALQGISIIWLPFGGTLVLDPVTSVMLTVLVVLVCINAINMVDGLDGLAAGIVGVASLGFFAYSYLLSAEIGFERATMATLISALLVGMCLGFLPYNYYPARIFMGDTGSMLLGFLLAAGIITLSGQVDPSAIESGTLLPALLPILLPLAVLVLPFLDLLLAVLRRTRRGRSPFAPDKMHIHHRLLEMGHSQRRTVLLMYAWTAVVAASAFALAFVPVAYALLILVLGTLAVAYAALLPRIRKTRENAALRRDKAGA